MDLGVQQPESGQGLPEEPGSPGKFQRFTDVVLHAVPQDGQSGFNGPLGPDQVDGLPGLGQVLHRHPQQQRRLPPQQLRPEQGVSGPFQQPVFRDRLTPDGGRMGQGGGQVPPELAAEHHRLLHPAVRRFPAGRLIAARQGQHAVQQQGGQPGALFPVFRPGERQQDLQSPGGEGALVHPEPEKAAAPQAGVPQGVAGGQGRVSRQTGGVAVLQDGLNQLQEGPGAVRRGAGQAGVPQGLQRRQQAPLIGHPALGQVRQQLFAVLAQDLGHDVPAGGPQAAAVLPCQQRRCLLGGILDHIQQVPPELAEGAGVLPQALKRVLAACEGAEQFEGI